MEQGLYRLHVQQVRHSLIWLLDEHIGRRTSEEVDIAQINAEIAKVNAYFGSDLMSEFID